MTAHPISLLCDTLAKAGRPVRKSPFAIRAEDALTWHHASQLQAGIAERAGYRVRARHVGWEVWATDGDFGHLVIQAAGDRP